MDKSREHKEEENPLGSNSVTAKEDGKRKEIVISIANDSPLRINVNVYVNADQRESCDSKVSEAFEEQLENHQSKVIIIRNTFKKTGLQEDTENVQTTSGSNDKMVLVSKQNYDDFLKYETKKSYTDFLYFERFLGSQADWNYTRVTEFDEDLFNMRKSYSLAHCVAEDLIMESGISVQFSELFKRHGVLFNQRQKQGGLAILSFPTRFIYYLVIKKSVMDKPTLYNMWISLTKMQKHMQENNITQVAIPRIGCGYNGLKWDNVKLMIERIFTNTDVIITVCNFKAKGLGFPTPAIRRKCKIVEVSYPVVLNGLIVYFGTEDGSVNSSMKEMDKRFCFLPDYKRGPRALGQVIQTNTSKGNRLIIGFIVKKSTKDVLDYTCVEKCAQEVNKINKKCGNQTYPLLALDRFQDPPDDEMQFQKVLDILRITLNDIDVYVCNSKNLGFLCS